MNVPMSRIEAIDKWFESTRTSRGYGGPIVHWWESCLGFTGAMADWRYEGIVCGYLNLYRRTDDEKWLQKAVRAGEDLLMAQRLDGCFDCSSFQRGPISGGTPHEAAVDIALLELASCLKDLGKSSWKNYAESAKRNIEDYHLKSLASFNGFVDQPGSQVVVSNKNATILEALLLAEQTIGCDYSTYITLATNAVLSAQSTFLDSYGGDIHYGSSPHFLITGIYTARSVSAVIRLYRLKGIPVLKEYIQRYIDYLRSLVTPSGT